MQDSTYLCDLCTDSLTLAYSFWQQVKKSDERFMQVKNEDALPHHDESKNSQFIFDTESVDDRINQEQAIDSPSKSNSSKRKLRKVKIKPKIIKKQIGVNIALPHFFIASVDMDDQETQVAFESDVNDMDGSKNEKKIKTLRPSAIIPPNLEKINELSMSPMEMDADLQAIYKCSHCPKAFASSHHLMIHMRKSHMCQYCLATFPRITDLCSHVKEMHKTFDCLLCSKEFQSNGNLRQHMRKNHSIFLPAHISLLNISEVNQ